MTSTTGKYRLPEKKLRTKYIQKNFNEIAKNYDFFNDLITFGMHRSWKNQVIKECQLEAYQSGVVLDLCCGSGDLSMRFARKCPLSFQIHSVDFSSEMLAILKKKTDKLALENQNRIHLHQADVTNLKMFKNNSIKAVSIGFGLRNVQERSKCLKEIYRVLEKNARLVILDVGHVKPAFIAFFHNIFFHSIVPLIGNLVHRTKHEMYSYLPASAKEYPDQEKLKAELEQAGFRDVVFKNKLFGASVIHIAQK